MLANGLDYIKAIFSRSLFGGSDPFWPGFRLDMVTDVSGAVGQSALN